MSGKGLPAFKIEPPTADELGPLEIDESRPADAKILHIDKRDGSVSFEKPDGSLFITGKIEPKRKDRSGQKFDENLADDDDVPTQKIVARLLEGIEADISSRAEWENTANEGRELLGVVLQKASSDVSPDGTISTVKHLGLIEAVVRSWANSRAELLPASGPVKVSDDLPALVANDKPQMGHNGGPPLDDAQPQPSLGPAPGGPLASQPAGGITGAQPPGPGIAGAPPPPSPAAPEPAAPAANTPLAGQPKRSELAEALEKDFNHFLTVKDREYYPDFSRMLLNRAINGIQFREVYRDPVLRRPASRWVQGVDVILSNDASHMSGAGRVTKRTKMRQPLVKRLMAIGHWRQVSLSQPVSSATPTEQTQAKLEGVKPSPQLPDDQPHTIYECYCELDDGALSEDETGKQPGFPLPYRVTIDKDSQQCLEIRRNWKQGDENFERRKRFVKYGFVPGLGFYDWGLVHLLGNSQRAVTGATRMTLDAGMFASFPGGLMAKGPGTRQRNSVIRPGPGEFAVVETGGMPIKEVVMQLPYKEPSAVLQSTAQSIAGDMRRLAGVLEVPVGEGRVGNVPVGTMMSYVDAITKVPSAIHKDDHAAQAEEFELLKELFMEEPEALTAGVKRPNWAKGYTLEELDDQELVPQADPNIPSQTHRIMSVQALAESANSPGFAGIADPRAIWAEIVKTLGKDPKDYTLPPQPPQAQPPDPRVVAAQMRLTGDQLKARAMQAKAQADADLKQAEMQIEAEQREMDRQSEERRAGMALAGKVMDNKVKAATHAGSLIADHAQHVDTIDQADRHKAADLAAAAQTPTEEPPEGQS